MELPSRKGVEDAASLRSQPPQGDHASPVVLGIAQFQVPVPPVILPMPILLTTSSAEDIPATTPTPSKRSLKRQAKMAKWEEKKKIKR